MRALRIAILWIALLLLLAGCSGRRHDERLDRIVGIVSDSPREALACLDSICPDSLTDADRHYYDFLSVKAADRAYVAHRSDSLILSVIDYYSRTPRDPLYPEALYYGGRVYSDMGDLPKALQYFHSALDTIPDSKELQGLRLRILSQTGRLLNSLRLYKEAIPYIEESLEIERALGDTVSEAYDLQLLGGVYLRDSDYEQAEHYLRKAFGKSRNMSLSRRAIMSMYMAGIKRKTGQIDSALLYVRGTPDLVEPVSRTTALACASQIYHAAGIPDTAYLYAHELVGSGYSLNKQVGYQVLLSPELRHLVPIDSAYRYIHEYASVIESMFNENENRKAVAQQTLYNYKTHEQEKDKIKEDYDNLKAWAGAAFLIIIILIIIILISKNRSKSRIIRLQQALADADNQAAPAGEAPTLADNPTEEGLREQFRSRLLSLYESSGQLPDVAASILQSAVYGRLQTMVADSRPIAQNDEIWKELEKVVLESSPKFVSNLNLLTVGRLTHLDLHTALLIKCGFKPSQMTILFGKSNGAIISRRETLCVKVLGEKKSVKVIDGVIRLL